MKLRTLLIGIELSALLSCTTSCILEFPTIINLCNTEWESNDSDLGYVELSFKCYEDGKYAFITQRDGSKQMGEWEDNGSDTCYYNIHLNCRSQINGQEIEIISAEIVSNCDDEKLQLTVTWFYTANSGAFHESIFTQITK